MTAKHTLFGLGVDTDQHDAWGSAMGTLFDIAHALEHYGNGAPADWEYRDSPICTGLDKHMSGENDSARYIAAQILRRGIEAEIVHAGNVLNRYTSILRSQGRDY